MLWDAAALSNTSGEFALFGSVPKLSSYIDNVLTPMVQALTNEPVCAATAPSLLHFNPPAPLPRPTAAATLRIPALAGAGELGHPERAGRVRLGRSYRRQPLLRHDGSLRHRRRLGADVRAWGRSSDPDATGVPMKQCPTVLCRRISRWLLPSETPVMRMQRHQWGWGRERGKRALATVRGSQRVALREARSNPPHHLPQVLRFIGLQAAAIHAADPRALVTIGAWSEASISSTSGGRGFNYYTEECLAATSLGGASVAASSAGVGVGDGRSATRSPGVGGSGLPMEGARLDYYQVHSYAPSNKPYGSTQPLSKWAGGFGLNVPLVVGEFSGGVHSGGLGPTEQYRQVFESGYAGAWGWSATNLGFYDGMRDLRDEASVARVELPAAADVTVCPGQWPWEGGEFKSLFGRATGRRTPAAQSGGSLLLRTDDEWTPSEYLRRKLARRDAAVRPDSG